jgi:hypothetical protein
MKAAFLKKNYIFVLSALI